MRGTREMREFERGEREERLKLLTGLKRWFGPSWV